MLVHILNIEGHVLIIDDVGYSKIPRTNMMAPILGGPCTLVYYQQTSGASGWLSVNGQCQSMSFWIRGTVPNSIGSGHFRMYFELDNGMVHAIDFLLKAPYNDTACIHIYISSDINITRCALNMYELSEIQAHAMISRT